MENIDRCLEFELNKILKDYSFETKEEKLLFWSNIQNIAENQKNIIQELEK